MYAAYRTRIKTQANRLDVHGEKESDEELKHSFVTSSVIVFVDVEMCKSSSRVSLKLNVN